MEAVIPETNPKEEKYVEEKDVDVRSKQSPDNSDYDSAGSYSENNDDDGVKSRQSDDDGGGGGGDGSVSEAEGSVGLERESGDGQESVPNKKVDDDEDKKNPQYIPKRGTFYEHDDRTAEDNDNLKTDEVEKEKEPKKKVWQDKKERWSHDRFNDTEQAPKSRAELVAIYGYDIRNEDGPPRARRRRRYGRGPNKYTRNWEDEDAYSKPPPNRVKKSPRKPSRGGGSGSGSNIELNTTNTNNKTRKSNRTNNYTDDEFPQLSSSNNIKNTNKTGDNKEFNRQESDRDNNRQSSERSEGETNGHIHTPTTSLSNDNASSSSSSLRSQNHDNNQSNKMQNLQQPQQQQQQRVGSGRVIKPKREIKDSDYKGFTTKTRQYRNLKTEQKIVPKGQQQQQQQSKRNDDFIQSQNFTNKHNNSQDLEKDMSKLNIQDTYKNNKHGSGNNGGNNQRQGSVPPRLQAEQKGSKRYSSIRQRSLPESQTPPFNQHSNYYSNEYNQQNQVSQQTIIHQQNTQIHPSTNQAPPQIAPPQLAPIPPQVPVTATTILQAPPPQFAPPFPQGPPPPPPPYLPAGVTGPPTFIPQQTPQIINYVPSQQFTQSYAGFQQQYNPVTQPTELYQQPSGITYYSTDQQVTQQRTVPQKRPKAAIPIVAPPQSDSKDKKDDTTTTIMPATTSTDDSDIIDKTIIIDNSNSNDNKNNNSNIDDNDTNTNTTVEQETVQQ